MVMKSDVAKLLGEQCSSTTNRHVCSKTRFKAPWGRFVSENTHVKPKTNEICDCSKLLAEQLAQGYYTN